MNQFTLARKLRSIEGLQEVRLEPVGGLVSPYFYIYGHVFLHGERYEFRTQIRVDEFHTADDVARLGASLLAAVAVANRKTAPKQQ